MITILPAGRRDFFAILRLEQACFGPDAWGPLELGWFLLTSGLRFKAVAGSRLVGFAAGERHASAGEGWVTTLGVHPDFQRQGAGRRLLAAVEAALATPVFKLTVRASNQPAQALYVQAGYRPVGRVARYYAGGEDGLIMARAAGSLIEPAGRVTIS